VEGKETDGRENGRWSSGIAGGVVEWTDRNIQSGRRVCQARGCCICNGLWKSKQQIVGALKICCGKMLLSGFWEFNRVIDMDTRMIRNPASFIIA